MPRFFFNVYDGVSSLDDSGTILLDWQQARIEAIRLTGAIFLDQAKQVALGEDWRIEVTDEGGLVLFRFDFISIMSPATEGRQTRSANHCELKLPEG